MLPSQSLNLLLRLSGLVEWTSTCRLVLSRFDLSSYSVVHARFPWSYHPKIAVYEITSPEITSPTITSYKISSPKIASYNITSPKIAPINITMSNIKVCRIAWPKIVVCGAPHNVVHTYWKSSTWSQRDQRFIFLDPLHHIPAPQLRWRI